MAHVRYNWRRKQKTNTSFSCSYIENVLFHSFGSSKFDFHLAVLDKEVYRNIIFKGQYKETADSFQSLNS